MVDRKGNRIYLGSRVKFFVAKNKQAQERYGGPTRKGTILHDHAIGSMLDIVLDGDPFGTYVEFNRVEAIPGPLDDKHPLIVARSKNMRTTVARSNQGHTDPEGGSVMPTATKPNPRELRKEAKSLGVEGWEDMSVRQLQAAVEKAQEAEDKPATSKGRRSTKAAAKPASNGTARASKATKASKPAAKKTAAKDDESTVAENGNPYKEGSNLWHITEEILKGGKRAAMVKRLKKKIDLKPRTAKDDYDEDYELDRRILITGQILRRDHNFEVERTGRGPEDGTIVGTPPG